MAIVNATNFRKNVYEFLTGVVEMNDEVIIATKNGNAILINEEDYKALLETAYLNSVPGLAQDIIDGMKTPLNECKEIDWENELSD